MAYPNIKKGMDQTPKIIGMYIANAITGVKLGGCGIYLKNNNKKHNPKKEGNLFSNTNFLNFIFKTCSQSLLKK